MDRSLDPAEELLLLWAAAMHEGGMPVDGWAEKAQGGFIDSWIKDFEEECEQADAYQIVKIQTAIDSLSLPHNRIIYKRHNICHMVWRFGDEEALYLAAKTAFGIRYFSNVEKKSQ